MEQVYIFTLSALFALAIFDLVVGVSNDAVNFLNSAFSSRAARLRTIMIVASIGDQPHHQSPRVLAYLRY